MKGQLEHWTVVDPYNNTIRDFTFRPKRRERMRCNICLQDKRGWRIYTDYPRCFLWIFKCNNCGNKTTQPELIDRKDKRFYAWTEEERQEFIDAGYLTPIKK